MYLKKEGAYFLEVLLKSFTAFTWQQGVMILIGALLIYLAVKKDMEPALLLPMGWIDLSKPAFVGVLSREIGDQRSNRYCGMVV